MIVTIRFRRGTTAEWTEANPVLTSGEPGWDTDTEQLKVGDGVSDWDELEWATLTEEQVNEITEILANLTMIDDERMTVVLDTEASDFTGQLASLVSSTGNPIGDALTTTITQQATPIAIAKSVAMSIALGG